MNKFKNLRSFLRNWDASITESVVDAEVKVSLLGNINIAGTAANGSPSHTLTRNDPRFYSFIEPGIRGLVQALIEKFDCITYSSCEGHPSIPGKTVFEPRHVGMIPRDYEEYLVLHKSLIYLTACVNERMCAPGSDHGVYIVTRIEPVESDDGDPLYGLDLYFYKLEDDEGKYFSEVNTATSMLTELVQAYQLEQTMNQAID